MGNSDRKWEQEMVMGTQNYNREQERGMGMGNFPFQFPSSPFYFPVPISSLSIPISGLSVPISVLSVPISGLSHPHSLQGSFYNLHRMSYQSLNLNLQKMGSFTLKIFIHNSSLNSSQIISFKSSMISSLMTNCEPLYMSLLPLKF